MSERKPKDTEYWFILINNTGEEVLARCLAHQDGVVVAWITDVQNYRDDSVIPLAPIPDYALWQETVAALEKLARLGNGDSYGNSNGNVIAQAALAKIKALGGE